MTTHRGTSNANSRGSSSDRRRRREYLVTAYRANVDVELVETRRREWDQIVVGIALRPVPLGAGVPVCRCYRCAILLTVDTVTVDRIVPGCKGGTYRRENIRPACGRCNSETGGVLGASRRGAA